jgi:hypothetical protein
MLLSGCAVAPAAPPDPADISQVPGRESTLYVSESVSVTRPAQPAPSAEELARAATQEQTKGMAAGAVAGGRKDQVIIRIDEANAPETAGAKPVLAVPALQPGAESGAPEEERSWKTPLPPLRSLEGE